MCEVFTDKVDRSGDPLKNGEFQHFWRGTKVVYRPERSYGYGTKMVFLPSRGAGACLNRQAAASLIVVRRFGQPFRPNHVFFCRNVFYFIF